jgi:hypothetical protein
MATRTHALRILTAFWLLALVPVTTATAQVGQPPADPPALELPVDTDTLRTLNPPVVLTWGEVAGTGTYEAQVFTVPDAEGQEPLPFRSRALEDPLFEVPSADLLAIADTARTQTYYWRVRARNDAGEGPWSDVWEFTIDLRPTVGPVDKQTVDEGQALAFVVPASDPLGSLTFSLDPASLALGMTVDPTTGAFEWTPSEAQGPGTYPVTIQVTAEDGAVAFITFDVIVGEINAPPVLGPIGGQQAEPNVALTFTAMATDEDLPANTLTYSLDASALALGMTIDPATGIFLWTPDESHDPGTYTIVVTVTDDGNPAQSDAETLTIQVGEEGTAPAIDPIADQAVDEGATLELTVSGSDGDTPPDSLTFTLDEAALALGMNVEGIDSTRAMVRWTPAEDQGPGDYTIALTATDDSGPQLSTSSTFRVIVNEVNAAPVLDPIEEPAGQAGVAITFTATATDTDLPANTLAFSLDSAAAALGMTIDAATGAFLWTPDESHDPGAYPATITVTDDGTPALADAQTILVRVGELGLAPVFDTVADQQIAEDSTLVLVVAARDGDTPPDSLIFTLDEASIALGLAIAGVDSASATITWTPTEAQGPGSYPVTVRATDDSPGAFFDEATFTVTVDEVNAAPAIEDIPDQNAAALQTLTLQASASDPDLPENSLAFRLDPASAALGMTVDAATGAFRWTPDGALVGATPSVTLYVDDRVAGDPALLSDSTTFTIAVGGGAPPLGTPDGVCSVLAEFPLVWSELLGADQYRVEIDTNPAFPSPTVATVTAPPYNVSLSALGEAQYYWRVTALNSVAGVSGVPSESRTFSRWPANITLGHTLDFPKATESGDFRMISVPGQAQGLSLTATFPGQSEGTDWRVFRDNSVATAYPVYLVQFEPGQNANDFQFVPGVGYWAISNSLWTVPAQTVPSVPLDQATSSFFPIPLNQGSGASDARWTMIGNPYPFPVSWQAIRDANGLTDGDDLWDWVGTQYASATTLQPYKGYYYFNRTNLPNLAMPCDLRFAIPVEGRVAEPALGLELALSAGDGTIRSLIRVGMDIRSDAQVDALDRFVPPAHFERERLTVVNEALDTRYPFLIQEVRSELGEGQSFDIELKATPGVPVTVTTSGLSAWAGAGAMFVDPVLGRTYDLAASPTVRLEPSTEFSRYRLLIGGASFLEKARSEVVPAEFRLLPAYPNPFAEHSVIEYALPDEGVVRMAVYNVLGQRVRTLVDGPREAGLHRVVWDGRGDAGESVASGVYFYVIETDGHRATRQTVKTR